MEEMSPLVMFDRQVPVYYRNKFMLLGTVKKFYEIIIENTLIFFLNKAFRAF
jgi:hypothetical protein